MTSPQAILIGAGLVAAATAGSIASKSSAIAQGAPVGTYRIVAAENRVFRINTITGEMFYCQVGQRPTPCLQLP